jgi:transcriptional regulator with XRE-family HTH domain
MMKIEEERDQLVQQLRDELRRLVFESGQTQVAIEQANGFTRGYLSQVLHAHVSLTARHVFGILLALDVPPSRFFSRLFPVPGTVEPDGLLSEIRERMARYDSAIQELEDKGLVSLPEPKAEE